MTWRDIQPTIEKRVRTIDTYEAGQMLATDRLEISGAVFTLKLRPDLLWEVELSYPTIDGPEIVCIGIEDSYSCSRRWVSNVLKNGEDTDMLDREIDEHSFLSFEDKPATRWKQGFLYTVIDPDEDDEDYIC